MKKHSKIIVLSVLVVFVALMAIFSLQKNTNLNDNNYVEEENPIMQEFGVYFASASEETGAATADNSKKGGSIYVGNGSTFTFDAGTIQNCEGVYGGAVYVANGGTFTMSGGHIDQNYATYGGAIYVEKGGKCTISGGSISYNLAEYAPAIYIEDGGSLQITNEKVIMEHNDVFNMEDCVVNYYVDGELDRSVLQMAPVLNLNYAPLGYAECNGYFRDVAMIDPIENGQIISDEKIEKGNSVLQYNLYTRTATLDKISVDAGVVSAINTNVSGDIVIPRVYNDAEITGIGLFKNTKNVTSIFMPATITSVGDGAFYQSALSEINFVNSITSIGQDTFMYCSNISKINIPTGISTIPYRMFCLSSLQSVFIPKNVTTITQVAFYQCSQLEEIIFEEGSSYLTIEQESFRFVAVKTLMIPARAFYIEYCAFANMAQIEKIYIKMNSQYSQYSVMEERVFQSSAAHIYCEIESQPSAWSGFWAPQAKSITFGHSFNVSSHLYYIQDGVVRMRDVCRCGCDYFANDRIVKNTIIVNPSNAQSVLDSNINGKTIVFSDGVYSEALELRPSRTTANIYSSNGGQNNFDMSNPRTLNYVLNNMAEIYHYTRDFYNITFVCTENVEFTNLFVFESGAVDTNGDSALAERYDAVKQGSMDNLPHYLSTLTMENIAFENFKFTGANGRIYSYLYSPHAKFKNVSVNGCSFITDVPGNDPNSVRNAAVYIGTAGLDTIMNFTFDRNTVRGHFQGLDIVNANCVTVTNNTISNTVHNAIAIQSSAKNTAQAYATGDIIINSNKIYNIQDRAIRFNTVHNAFIQLMYNEIVNSGDEDGEVIRTENLTETTWSYWYNTIDGKLVEVDDRSYYYGEIGQVVYTNE